MKTTSKLFLGWAIASCLVPWANAADLLQPQRIKSHFDRLSVKLIAARGPVNVSGFGQVNNLFLYGVQGHGVPSLLPPVLALEKKDRLDVELQNRLPCRPQEVAANGTPLHITNLHMHGFITSPNTKTADGRYGDYVLVSVLPNNCAPAASAMHAHGAGHAAGDVVPMPVETGKILYRYQLPHDHPEGLSWYHPHIHGTSGTQLAGGLAGLVTIGSLWDYTYVSCSIAGDGDAPKCGSLTEINRELRARRNTDERVLLLKDFQVSGQPGNWQYNTSFAPDWCGGAPAESALPGVCANPDTPSQRWLFTLNGQLTPTIRIPTGRHQVWRMANMSANVTHLIQLTVRYGNRDYVVPLQRLAQDGVSITGATASSPETLMMPAARAELLVDTASVCRAIGLSPCRLDKPLTGTLKTLGMAKDAGNVPATGADIWPAMTLAKVEFAAGSPKAVDVDYSLSVFARPFHELREFAARRSLAAPVASSLPGLGKRCTGGAAPDMLTNDQYRLIGLKNYIDPVSGEHFEMAYAGVRQVTEGQRDFVIDPANYHEFQMSKPEICVGADIQGRYQETWVIKNDSDEIHNFHLHQSKFEVLDNQNGIGLIKQVAPGAGKFVDVYAVDAGGWIRIRLTFDHDEQVGTYVYHCHILEHEDRGMMSLIQVVDVSRSGL